MKKLLVLTLALLSAAVFTACDFPMHEHIEGQWEFNDSQHWQSVTCTWHTCNINIVSYDHIDKDENGLCDVCGYLMLGSSSLVEWQYNATYHWCPKGGCLFIVSTHTDEDTNGICDTCGYKYSIDTEADNVQ